MFKQRYDKMCFDCKVLAVLEEKEETGLPARMFPLSSS